MGSQRRKAFGGLSVPHNSYWNSPCCIVGFGSASQNLWGGVSVSQNRKILCGFSMSQMGSSVLYNWSLPCVANSLVGSPCRTIQIWLLRDGVGSFFASQNLLWDLSQLPRVAAPPCRSAAVSQLHRVARGISAAVTGGGSGSPLPVGVGRGRHVR